MSTNLLQDLPASLPAELVTTLVTSGSVRIERIVSTGHRSPDGFWYDQEEHEWVVVLQGEGHLRFEDGQQLKLCTGDHVLIHAGRKHRVDWTCGDEPTVWLAVFFRG